jgi:hypothetical protein
MTDNGTKPRRAKGVLPPAELQVAVALKLREIGVAAAAADSGQHREQLLSVAAGQRVLVGTVMRTQAWLLGKVAS